MGENKPALENAPDLGKLSAAAKPLWTVHDVAQYLRLEPATVRLMARSGKLPAIKVGRFWRFKKNLIEKYFLEAL